MNILSKNNIMIVEQVNDWKEAVKLSVEMLINNGSVKPEYLTNIYKNVEELGPYMLLCPEVVMPHCRPEDGALNKSISLLKLNKPVKFFDNDTYLYISISAIDSDSHIDYIQNIVKVISEDELLQSLLKAKDIDTIFNIFNGL
ncbi:PTS mannitol transporter subunit IIA [Brachyspira aalborgi]|uniref:Ascorbate-specific PTS system EIIA component n=1 Tax=Brachyspira aalborgi TaxID=29522 RepID=A0A5C8GIB0_9SPIR|nr:PTS sugar transporter subunit IIA [Brachyspira aalborgi]TXJ61753.1 PTS mannitol transporter subunit IIA [Brachyspira aalborgi]